MGVFLIYEVCVCKEQAVVVMVDPGGGEYEYV